MTCKLISMCKNSGVILYNLVFQGCYDFETTLKQAVEQWWCSYLWEQRVRSPGRRVLGRGPPLLAPLSQCSETH